MSLLETLNSDLLDERFTEIFKPLIFLETLTCSARVNIKHKYVTSPLWYQKVFSIFYATYSVCCRVSLSAWWAIHREQYGISLIQILLFNTQIYGTLILNFSVILLNNFRYQKENTKLIVTMQRIDRLLDNINTDGYGEKLRRFGIIGIAVAFAECLFVSAPKWSPLEIEYVVKLSTQMFFIAAYLDVLLLFSVMFFLCGRTRQVNEIVEKRLDGDDEQIGRRVQMVFKNVVIIHEIVKKTFSPLILLIVMSAFCSHLIALQKFIKMENSKDVLLIFQIDLILLRHDCIIIALGFTAIYLETQMERLMMNVILVIAKKRKEKQASVRRAMKNAHRQLCLLEPASVFRLFLVRTLPLNLASVTTDYAIVLLQFAFLFNDSPSNGGSRPQQLS